MVLLPFSATCIWSFTVQMVQRAGGETRKTQIIRVLTWFTHSHLAPYTYHGNGYVDHYGLLLFSPNQNPHPSLCGYQN